MVSSIYNSSTWVPEAGGSKVGGQPSLDSETSQQQQKNINKNRAII